MWFILALLPVALSVPVANRPGPPEEYFDILDKDLKEWRLVFRGQTGISKSMYDAYLTGSDIGTVPDACKGVDWSLPCDSHYRNADALDNQWSNIRDVLVGIVDEGALVKTLRFDGRNTDKLSWFADIKLLDSCLPDLPREPHNYFSILGHERTSTNPAVLRRFFINRNYGGCPNDAGWLVVVDGGDNARTCDWEKDGLTFPVLKYAAGLTVVNWNDKTQFKNGDALVVFVRYEDEQSADEYFDVLNTGLKEYRLAFRGTADVGQPMYPAYMDGTGIPSSVQIGCKQIDWTAECNSHYRNDQAMDNWKHIKEVLVTIVHKGVIVKYLKFRGDATNKESYFTYQNLWDSCYEDLKDLQQSDFNYFSIKGHERSNDSPVRRRFFINRNYGGCSNDAGWLAVIDNALNGPCPWERYDKTPTIMYAANPRVDNWTSGAVKHADALVIFLKYDYPISRDMLM